MFYWDGSSGGVCLNETHLIQPGQGLGWFKEQHLESLGRISKGENCRMTIISGFPGDPPSTQGSGGVLIPETVQKGVDVALEDVV